MSLIDQSPKQAEAPRSVSKGRRSGSALVVGNYRPDVGFAWWLMENFWVQTARLADSFGMNTLICYPIAGEIPTSITEAGIHPIIQAFPGRSLTEMIAAVRLVRQRNIRFVYFTDRPFTDFRYFILRCAGVRKIVTHDHTPGDRPPIGGLKGVLKAIWRRIPMMSADLHLCVSPFIRDRAVSNARIPAARAFVVQNGIPPISSDAGPTYAHGQFNLPADARICITVGRAHPYKRIDFVIEVARRCATAPGLDNLYFIHCGDGPDMPRLHSLVQEYNLTNRFIFAGRRNDVHQLLCSSTYAVHAAAGEAFSLAILEYMGAGLCVLVPDIPSVAQAVDHGETGLLYPDGDADAAVNLLVALDQNAPERTRLQTASRRAVADKYSLEAMNTDFTRIIDDVVRTASKP